MSNWRLEKLHSRNFKFILYIKYYWDDQMKESLTSGECSIYGRNEKHVTFGWKTSREETIRQTYM
jgi:hypothetical protein